MLKTVCHWNVKHSVCPFVVCVLSYKHITYIYLTILTLLWKIQKLLVYSAQGFQINIGPFSENFMNNFKNLSWKTARYTIIVLNENMRLLWRKFLFNFQKKILFFFYVCLTIFHSTKKHTHSRHTDTTTTYRFSHNQQLFNRITNRRI